jgi:hypothetical protein
MSSFNILIIDIFKCQVVRQTQFNFLALTFDVTDLQTDQRVDK